MKLSERLLTLPRRKTGEPVILPYAGWMPDKPDFMNPGATTITNVIPDETSFRPFLDFSADSDAMDARPLGAAAAKDTDGNVQFYAGDRTKLYGLSDNTWSDISKAGGYSTAEDGSWEFTQFGNTGIATNFAEPVQSISLGGTIFADLITSTNKPRARHVATVLDFVMLGNTYDSTDGDKPNRVWWSKLNDSTDFDPSASTQSDYQDIPEGGWVQRVLGGYMYALVFLETSIQRLYYVGSPLIFDRDPVDRQRGTFIPNSVIGHGALAGFISEEGFMVTSGGEAQNIGDGSVNRDFLNQFDRSYISRVSAAYDPISNVMMWAFPGTGNTGGRPNMINMVHLPTKRWSRVEIDLEMILRTMEQGYTLDGLDAVSTDIDSLTFSLDSRAWTGGQIKLAAIGTLFKLGFFDGASLAAVLETAEVQPNRKGRSTVYMARPLVDGGTPTMAIASRARLQDTVTFGTAATVDANGDCTMLSEGRYHRARTTIPAASTWTHAQGAEIFANDDGDQ